MNSELEDKVGLSAIAELEEDAEAEPDASEHPDAEQANKKQPAKEAAPVNTEGLQLIEAVVRNDSMMINRSVRQLRLNHQFGLHLVAVARTAGA